jgi:antirestriction protein ArdC
MADKVKFDVHQAITDKIVAAIEKGAGKFRMPWAQPGGGVRPINVQSGKFYRGVNVVTLWFEATERGYGSNVWGTYNQWQEKGAQVRKGEKGALGIFFKTYTRSVDGEDQNAMVARASNLFNAAQVDGWTAPAEKVLVPGGAEALVAVDEFVRNTKAAIDTRGTKAFYVPSTDQVVMPPMALFHGSKTSSPTESYYSTLLHELVHWTGAKGRLDRDFSGRFGTEAYAVEELVAEMGAAFLCADLSISPEPRADHAQYVASWLKVLKGDKKAVFTAASKASAAFDHLVGLQPGLHENATSEAPIAA